MSISLGSWEYEFLFDPPDFVGIEAEFHSFNKYISLTLMSASMDFPYVSGAVTVFLGERLLYD